MPNAAGYIYAIGMEGTPHVKIGCTRGSVEQRCKRLQTGQPFPLQVLAAIPVENDVRRIEHTIHTFLEAERQQGEWFVVDVDQAKLEALIVRAVQYLQEQADRKAQARAVQQQEDQDPSISPLKRTLGKRVREQRKQGGWTQQELAKVTGIPYPTLSRIEHGEQSMHYERIVALANALNVSTDYLLNRTDDPTPPKKRQRSRKAGRVHQEACHA